MLDDLKDLGNIGTIIRTCNAFSIHRIVSTNRETDIYSRRTVEASRGTVFSTRTERYPSAEHAIKRLREGGYQIIATSPRGNKLQSLLELQAKPVALVLGNESTGVNKVFEREADYLIQIPMSSAIESLNVGVAAGISVYELRLKQVMSMIVKNIRSTLGRELNVTGMLVQKALDAELRKVSDLSSQQVVFMMVLRCDLEMSVKDMCQQFGILESRTEEFLEPLKERGLVLYDESLRLTPKGEDLLAKLWFTVENAESKILSGFSQNEIETLKKQMSRIQANCVQLMD